MTLRKLEIFVIVAIIAVIGVVYALTQKPVLAPSNTETSQNPNPTPSQGIAIGEPHPGMIIVYAGVDGRNALDLLKASHSVDIKSYSFGDMVTGIDGISADEKKFWAMYVNGQMSQVGASQYVTKSTDRIEWKLEEIKY